MFDIGWGELVVIGVVALIAIGPKELPGVLRTTGVWMGKIRRMANEFQDQFREAMREAEMEDLKKTVDDVTSAPSNLTNFDPIGTVRKEVEGLMNDGKAQSAAPETTAAASAPAETKPKTLADAKQPDSVKQHSQTERKFEGSTS